MKTKISELQLRLALAPIQHFYTSWHRDSGTPQPESLSRHVSVHQADPRHYTKGNAIVAAMLAASVLRALQEFQEATNMSKIRVEAHLRAGVQSGAARHGSSLTSALSGMPPPPC